MADAKKVATGTTTGGKELPAPAPARRRGGLVSFYREVRSEVSKVTWPTWKETYLTTFMVFMMVVLTMVFFAVVDVIFQYGETLLIGARTLF
jgi:preprotein translocase subunit SecE